MSVMQNKTKTNLERIIAKIDNDFNPDNSDWIPRVGAWVIDAMQQIDAIPTKTVRKTLPVKERIAYSSCQLDDNIKVYDENGCVIKEANASKCQSCGSPSTGGRTSEASAIEEYNTTKTTDIINNPHYNRASTYVKSDTTNTTLPPRYNVTGYIRGSEEDRNYVLVDNNKIELNFDTNNITIEYEGIETVCSETYGCELPVIPNNGYLIEAIAYFCMYKMLLRGYKHPVMNLAASQYGTNPYYLWTELKSKAKDSIINDKVDDALNKGDGGIWRSKFFIETFDPRR